MMLAMSSIIRRIRLVQRPSADRGHKTELVLGWLPHLGVLAGSATGARPVRPLPAALLASLLLAPLPAAAHHAASGELGRHWEVTLSSSEVTEGESVTVSIRCVSSYCLAIPIVYPTRHSSAYFDLAVTNAAGVSLSANRRLSFEPYLNSLRSVGSFSGRAPAGTVTISIADDMIVNGARTVTVSGSAPYWAVAPNRDPGGPSGSESSYWYHTDDIRPFIQSATLTVRDNDARPTRARIALTSSSISESGAANSTAVTASLPSALSSAVTLTVSAAPVNPAVAGDFELSANRTLTIPAGQTNSTGTVTIAAVDNAVDAPNKSVTVSATASGGGVPNPADVTLTIVDDDASPTVTLSLDNASIAEDGGTAQVSAALTGGTTSSAATTVTVLPSTGFYTVPLANVITIAAGSTTSTGRVRIMAVDNNARDEPDRTTTVTGTAVNSHGVNATVVGAPLTLEDSDTGPVTVTVEGDGPAGLIVAESGGSTAVAETGTTDSFSVRLAALPTANVTVTATASDSTECELQVGSGAYGNTATLTFTPSTQATLWSTPQTVTVRGVDDSVHDGSQTCSITLDPSSPPPGGDSDYHGLPNWAMVVTVRDDEASPTLALASVSIGESGAGNSTAVTALLPSALPTAVTLTVSAAPVNPAVAEDFTLSANRTLTIAAGQTSSTGTVTITAVDNVVDAPDKLVTVSATASGGSALNPADVALTIMDDEASPTVTLSLDDASIAENGGTAQVSAALDHASSEATTVTVTPAPGFYTVASANTIAIAAGLTTSTGRVTITAVDNNVQDEPNRTTTVAGTVANSHGVNAVVTGASLTLEDSGTGAVTVTVEDEGPPPPATLVLEDTSIAEDGGTTTVSARLSRASSEATTITVQAMPGVYTVGAEATIVISAGSTTSPDRVTITAVDNAQRSDLDQTVVVSGVASNVRGAGSLTGARLTVRDDESVSVLLVLEAERVSEGETTRVAAQLSRPAQAAVTLTVVAVAPTAAASFVLGPARTLTVAAGSTASAGSVTIAATDDEIEAPDRTVFVSASVEAGSPVRTPGFTKLTIQDDDGTEAETDLLLPAAARAMADSRATAVRQRLERAAAGAAAAAELPTLTGLLERHGPALQADEGLEWKKTLLPQASFALPLHAGHADGGGGLTLWGGGDYRDLDGEADGVKWDGEVASAHLGADRLLANGLRLGLAGTWSEAQFDYEHRGRAGEWTLEMGSAQPYLGWTTAGGTLLWASAGYGSGELEQDFGGGRRETADADMRMAAAGARGPVYAAAGLEVSLRGEALYAKFEVDGNGAGIAAHDSDVSRLRLAVAARRERVLESGAVVSPRLELGARHDGGDGETGAGAELGAGVGYASGRLSAALGARALVANSNYDEWGANLSLAYAAGADGRGLTFRLAPAWGAAQSGTAALWEQGAPGLDGGAAAAPERGGRMEAELGYGLKSPLSRGLLTLAAGGEWGEDAGSVCRLSGTVALDATASLGLELELRDPKSGGAERSLMLRAELKF